MEFIIDNWPWLLAIFVFVIMTIIGYYAEKTGYTQKIKFKKGEELPTFDINGDPLENVDEVEATKIVENEIEEEFNESQSTEKMAEKLIEDLDREPDIRDIEEKSGIDNYEYMDLSDDDSVNVLYEVVDQNGDFDPNNVAFTNSSLSEEETAKIKTLLESYDETIKPNIETKKIFGEEVGYLDKGAAEKLLKIIKQYEKDIKPGMTDIETTDSILLDLLNVGSKVTSSNTLNYENSSKLIELLNRYEDIIKPSINDAKNMQKLLENVEDYRNYISSKTITSTNEDVFNMLETYINNISNSLTETKLLNLIRNYEKEVKPNINNTTRTDEILNNIMGENNNLLKEKVPDEVVDNVNGLLDEYKNIIDESLKDKKLYKKILDIVEDYQKFVLSKRSIPLVTEVVGLEEKYDKYIKPNILNKSLFGEETGYLDKNAAEKLLKIIKEYEKEVKPNIPNSEEMNEVLTSLVETESKVTTANTISYEVSSNILDLLEKYETGIKENIALEKILEKVIENVDDYRDYISSKTTSDANKNIFNMLEAYANNLNENNSNDKLLDLVGNYEMEIKPNISDTTKTDEVLTNIMSENNDLLKEDVSDEVVDHINDLLVQYKNLVGTTLEDKKVFKKFLDLLENYQEFVLSKRSTPIANEAIISEAEKEEILSLSEQYHKYIKPYILTKTLFGKEDGFIDKKYANNILDLINEYERNIKDSLADSTVASDLLNKIIDFSSATDFKNITLEQIEKCEGMLNEFKTIINENVTDEKELAKTNEPIDEISAYLDSLKPATEEMTVTDNTLIDLMPVVIPSKKKEEVMPVVIPSKKKESKIISKVKETVKKFKKSSDIDEIIDIIKENEVTDAATIEKSSKKKKKSTIIKDQQNSDNLEEILDIIKEEEVKVIPSKKKKVKKEKVNTVSEEKPVVIKSSKKNKKAKVENATDKTKEKKKINTVEKNIKLDENKPVVIKSSKKKKTTERKFTTTEEILDIIKEEEVKVIPSKKKSKKSNEDVPIISSKTNRNKKKKQNKIEKEIKKLEKIEKAFEEDLKSVNKSISESNEIVDDYDLEYDMIEANEEDYDE